MRAKTMLSNSLAKNAVISKKTLFLLSEVKIDFFRLIRFWFRITEWNVGDGEIM